MFAARNMLFASSAAALSYRSTVLADNPVAYWRLGESSGTTAADEIGSHSGTYVGSPTLGVTGAVYGNTAAGFNGSNQYVTVADHAELRPLGDMTVEAWVKFNSLDGSDAKDIVQKDSNGTGYAFGAIPGTFGWFYFAQKTYIPSYVVPMAGQWYHAVMVRNGTNGGIWINGSRIMNRTVNALAITDTVALNIARKATGNTNYANALIDEVAIYNTALSAERIAAHYAEATS